MITPVRTGRPFADYHAAFGRFVRVLFFAGQKTASAKMAATRRNVCRRCEQFLRQQKLHLHKSALSCVDGVCFAREKCFDCAVGQYSPVSGL